MDNLRNKVWVVKNKNKKQIVGIFFPGSIEESDEWRFRQTQIGCSSSCEYG